MLLLVLCSVSVSVVKQKLNFFSPSTYRKSWITMPEYVSAFLASNYYCSNLGKKLINVIASCLRAVIAVSFWKQIFSSLCQFITSRTKALRVDYFKAWTPATT